MSASPRLHRRVCIAASALPHCIAASASPHCIAASACLHRPDVCIVRAKIFAVMNRTMKTIGWSMTSAQWASLSAYKWTNRISPLYIRTAVVSGQCRHAGIATGSGNVPRSFGPSAIVHTSFHVTIPWTGRFDLLHCLHFTLGCE